LFDEPTNTVIRRLGAVDSLQEYPEAHSQVVIDVRKRSGRGPQPFPNLVRNRVVVQRRPFQTFDEFYRNAE
jgi:hypothetical protein